MYQDDIKLINSLNGVNRSFHDDTNKYLPCIKHNSIIESIFNG